MAVDNSKREVFLLQPTKSVVMEAQPSKAKTTSNAEDHVWTLDGKEMPIVDHTTHIGVYRSTFLQDPAAIDNNIQKSRRAMYRLMPAGLHGVNGLDPQSAVHVFRINVEPVLLYGFEVSLPKGNNLETMEVYLCTCLKQILTLPKNTSSPAIYILTGYLPVEALIDKRALSLFGGICRMPASSVEKQLAYRQLNVKSISSNSWYIQIRAILLKYNLPPALDLLSSSYSKYSWKRVVRNAVDTYWVSKITGEAEMHRSLQFLNIRSFVPGKSHPLLNVITGSAREASRIHARLMIATGTYVLQTNRASYSQNACEATCLLECSALEETRRPILQEVLKARDDVQRPNGTEMGLIQLIVDCTGLAHCDGAQSVKPEHIQRLQYHAGRLVYALHALRYKKLELTPKPKKKRLKRT